MSIPFDTASGSVAGKDHRTGVPKNRQDDYCILRSDKALVAVVSDGCGSGGLASTGNPFVSAAGSSELGASLAVRLMAQGLMRAIASGYGASQKVVWQVQRDVEAQLRVIAMNMGPSLSEVVDRYFLFTLLGAVVTSERALFFGLGDGLILVNGVPVGESVLQADEHNQPVYLGYALTGSQLTDQDPSRLNISVVHEAPSAEVEHFLLATDGAYELIAHADTLLPGLDKPIGPISQFWEDPRYFNNPAAVSRQLNLAARDWHRTLPDGTVVRSGGLLHDDVTIVVGRKTPATEEE